jgi:two-component system phosphate regulon sensor histidine kinase PhoR
MEFFSFRRVMALALAALAAAAAWLIAGNLQAALVVLVGSAAAVLVAMDPEDTPPAEPVVAPPAPPAPDMGAELIEALVDPVLIVAAEGQVTRANAAARDLLGQHILGQDVRVAIRHPAATGPLTSTSDKPATTHLVGLGTRDQRWEMRVARLSDGRRVVELIDQTDSYATERMRVDFVANASHELRTPLASLIGYVETLSDDAGDDPGTRRRFLQIMHGEATRMARLIEDLMSLSRIEAEKYRLPDEEVEMGSLILRVCEELSATADGRAEDLVIDVDAEASVRGDSAQLSQLLHNIIGNALKYGRPGTPVRVSQRDEGSMVRIAVADEGEGVAPEHIPRLTERFYRVDSGRSRAMGGTGLGLAIVRHIVERHRGRLDIASTVGKGTTVTVLLPQHRVS